MADEHIVTYVGRIGDGQHVVRHPDGRLEIQKDQTDWARIDALTEEDIKVAMTGDPDWAGFEDIDWSKVEAKPFRPKQAISIRLDPDVLDFFKGEGPGYQGRINQVLRHFMAQKRKAG